MKFIEYIKEVLLALGIAIMIPVIVYWGVNIFYSVNDVKSKYPYSETESLSDEKNPDIIVDQKLAAKESVEKHETMDTYRQISFWTFLIFAIIAIFIGTFIKINSLSLGFIGGGVFNLIWGITNSSNRPLMNFCIFLLLLLTLIFIIVRGDKEK